MKETDQIIAEALEKIKLLTGNSRDKRFVGTLGHSYRFKLVSKEVELFKQFSEVVIEASKTNNIFHYENLIGDQSSTQVELYLKEVRESALAIVKSISNSSSDEARSSLQELNYEINRFNNNLTDYLVTLSAMLIVVGNSYSSQLIDGLLDQVHEKPTKLQQEEYLENSRQVAVELTDLVEKFRAQYDLIVKQRREAEESRSEISNIVKGVEDFQGSIEQEASIIEKKLEKLRQISSRLDSELEAYNAVLTNSTDELDTLIKNAKNTDAKLQQLLDPAVAHDLLSTFKRRKRWLFIATIVWAIFGLASAVTLGWQTSVLLTAPGDLSLERTLSISLRILPFIVLLFFCLRQFTKNRNLEEEYAFRESIATSMMSYVSKIEGDTKLKEELIRDTVLKLYTSPLAKIVEASKGTSEAKQSEALIQSVADLLKQTTSVVRKSE